MKKKQPTTPFETKAIKPYFKYWGKAERQEDGKARQYHLLPYHCLDVASVGWLLLDPEKSQCMHLAQRLEVSPEWLRVFFVFCLALHDIGKFARAFQGLVPGLSSSLVTADSRTIYDSNKARHDTLGFFFWTEILKQKLSEKFDLDTLTANRLDNWLEIVTGHHGMPPKKSGVRFRDFCLQEDEEAAWSFVEDACTVFPGLDFTLLQDKALSKRLRMASWQLAGIAVLADWLGSNMEYFEYCTVPKNLSDYWEGHALHAAAKVIQSMPGQPEPNSFSSMKFLFPFIDRPTPLQEYAVSTPLHSGPQLFILEDVTGSGKTEAALVLIQRLMAAGMADGLYLALPTMATANAMYSRLCKVYEKLFSGSTRPSLVLAHGARDLSEAFRQSVFLPEAGGEEESYDKNSHLEDAELSASAYCNAWLADNRKKALLADVGVGTIDQALLAVLPVRHQSLRLLGLARKVLLVDEVHAYDCYMQKLLGTLLEAHARQGGSVILLSATLPQAMREQLVKAFQRGLGCEEPLLQDKSYPLATSFSSDGAEETHICTREEVKRRVAVSCLDTEDDCLDVIRQAVTHNKCVCWIRNTVRAARESHRLLAGCEWLGNDNLHLFHSRFAMVDRQRIEAVVVRCFGPDSKHEERAGQVLVATQVVEQSLDLDFDLLITDLAPVDLVLQRAGRLCRHVRDELGNRLRGEGDKEQRGEPLLYLLVPHPEAFDGEDWLDRLKQQQKGTMSVYPHLGRLWLTAKMLLLDQDGSFAMPYDARSLIEGVYSQEAEDSVPEAIMESSWEAETRDMSQRSMADLNTLNLAKGYTRSSGDWDEEVRIPTRLNEVESVTVVLVVPGEAGLLPYARGNGHYEWPLSTVKVPEWEWQEAKGQIPAALAETIDELKAETKVLRWFEVFPLVEETAHFYSAADGWQTEKGEDR